MGSGASSLARVRKALIIRAYNLRKNDETLDEQFRKFTYRNPKGQLCISLNDVKTCLDIEPGEYAWIEKLFCHSLGEGAAMEMNYMDFIKFLESGKLPSQEPGVSSSGKLSRQGSERSSDGNLRLNSTFLPDNRATAHMNPPRPPVVSNDHHISEAGGGAGGTTRQRVWSTDGIAASSHDERQEGQEGEVVLSINLSNINSNVDLPESIKLHSEAKPKRSNNNNDDDDDELSSADPSSSTFTVIVHPSNKSNNNSMVSNPQALWRKREVVKQERAVYYTTMDAEGALQELVERETTQTEILHMECRETGEFAHRETTKYEQIETFNSEVVAETEGAEEYVHLKSLEDEFHYMESTMPRKEEQEEGGGGRPHHGGDEQEQQHPLEDSPGPREGGGPRYYYDDNEGTEQAGGSPTSGRAGGELPDDAPLEEYGFDLDQFAAASKERTNTVHTPQYCMDPNYDQDEEEGGVGGSPRSPPPHKRDGGRREQLFGEKVELDEHYGMDAHHHTTSATTGSGGVVYESKGDLKEVVGLRASASYESLHDID